MSLSNKIYFVTPRSTRGSHKQHKYYITKHKQNDSFANKFDEKCIEFNKRDVQAG